MAAMGWSDSHSHEFEIRGRKYDSSDPEFAHEKHPFSSRKYRLNQVLSDGGICINLYDFGDSWTHRITVENIKDLDERASQSRNVWVKSGARGQSCVRRRWCRSIPGFLGPLENDPNGEETKATPQWNGLDFDP